MHMHMLYHVHQVSRAGARVQRFHVDATHSHFEAARANPSIRMYSVFIPLVDICEDGEYEEGSVNIVSVNTVGVKNVRVKTVRCDLLTY